VAIKGANDDEILDFARLTLDKPFQVRFIEMMGWVDGAKSEQSLSLNDVVWKRSTGYTPGIRKRPEQ